MVQRKAFLSCLAVPNVVGGVSFVAIVALWTVVSAAAQGQEILPRPDQPFKGKIGRTAKESTPDFPTAVEAPKGAPNVLLILTDDVGFGASSTFGSSAFGGSGSSPRALSARRLPNRRNGSANSFKSIPYALI